MSNRDVADKQLDIDVSNLSFYSRLFRQHQWGTEVIHWSVFETTLAEIADRLVALQAERDSLKAENLRLRAPVSEHEAEDALNGYYENGGHQVMRQVKGMQVAYARIIASRMEEK